MHNEVYHYTESGLDAVYLLNGYDFVNGGQGVVIHDIDGLHNAIGRALLDRKKLTGAEIRFLRTELLLSQAALGRVFGVKELTVARWEKGAKMPRAAEATLRKMYAEHIGENETITALLERIADLEDQLDEKMILEEDDGGWDVAA